MVELASGSMTTGAETNTSYNQSVAFASDQTLEHYQICVSRLWRTANNLNAFKRSIVRVDFKSFLQCY